MLQGDVRRYALGGKKSFDLGRENDSVRGFGEIEWLDADSISRQKQRAFDRVPDGKGKHAVQVLQALGAFLGVESQDDLRIRFRLEHITGYFELLAYLE